MGSGRMRIAILVALLPPEHHGGAERQAERLARELAERGHDVHVFARSQAGHTGLEWRDGVRIHRRPVLWFPFLRMLLEIGLGGWQVARQRPDVILCYITYNNALIGLAASSICKAPVVLWQRVEAEGLRHASAWQRQVTPRIHRRVRAIWIQSERFLASNKLAYAAAGHAGEWDAVAGRFSVMGNGTDLHSAEATVVPPPLRVLFVGRLTAQKELMTLVAAARMVPECKVWIVGSGPSEPELRAAAKDTSIEFFGAKNHEEVAKLFSLCRALVLCSSYEGTPNVVLEALAHGRPVIATPVGAIPELIRNRDNGLLVAVGDTESLASAIRALADDSLWGELAAKARPSVARFAWPALVDRVEAELARIVAAG